MRLENFLPRTSEHKSFLSHFIAPLTAFIVVFGVIISLLN
jgi:hypothetical protein